MRITGGSLKNRHIECPKGIIRPAMDRMRESVFSILGNVEGLSFLDLFTGSGICGLEAYSRGAYPVCLIEKDPVKFPILLKNVSLAEKRLECKRMPVELFVKKSKTAFDIIYIDPPFPYRFHLDLLKAISDSAVVKEGSLVLMHRPSEKEMPQTVQTLTKREQRVYGRSVVDFYVKRQP